MNKRRRFLGQLGLLSGSALGTMLWQPAWSRELQENLVDHELDLPDELASDESFWKSVQKAFVNKTDVINLNNGGVSPAPKIVANAMKHNYDFVNQVPSLFMWRDMDKGREPLRKRLAALAGCNEDEICINRNATEGLETIIFGLKLKAGDEIVAAKQDYPHPVFAWKQREKRDGIHVKWVNLDLPSEDDDYMVGAFMAACSSKTRLIHLTHIINWNGQILPVKKITEEAHRRGIEVMLDGAHSFAHFNFSLADLGVDYFATSLHKWLYAPIGSGMMFVKKEKIGDLYPLFAGEDPEKKDIRKFEHLGTRPFYIEQAINKAIDFHESIGIERKQERLHYLKNYWMEKAGRIKGVSLHTSLSKDYGCAIGLFSIAGKKVADVADRLLVKHKLHTVGIKWENINGVRVTPNLYTNLDQLNKLVNGIEELAAE